jgi:hypothetical protein
MVHQITYIGKIKNTVGKLINENLALTAVIFFIKELITGSFLNFIIIMTYAC